jgi:predicted Fe-S protein YdhL (DUF1289 family)
MQVTSTPCIAICRIDEGSGLCVGCGRSRPEIAAWVDLGEPARLALMGQLPRRFQENPELATARAAYRDEMAGRGRTGRRRRS